MIILNSFNKIDILYRNYVKQFSKAYIKGSNLYVGDSLKNSKYFRKSVFVQNIIKTYKNIFIELYMNNNKIYEEVNNENLCVICLEELNEDIMDVCHKCNVKCHIKCLYDWHKQNNEEICPICLQTEQYYLDLLEGNNAKNNDNNMVENINNIEDIEEGNNENINTIDNNIIVYQPKIRQKNCMIICCMFLVIASIIFFDKF